MQSATNRPVDINVLFNRPTIKGWELRQGIEQFAQATVSALGLRSVNVQWENSVPTARINSYGRIELHAVADDAVVTHATLIRYAGFVLHEALHWKYTDFNAVTARVTNRQYIAALHNAIEDAYIERKGIANALLGNITGLLSGLLEGMLAEIPADIDWADPAQYPFSLAIYAREYCPRVPVPANILPIFEAATRKLDSAKNSLDCLRIAEWVYDQLDMLPDNPPQDKPNSGNDSPSEPEEASGDADGDAAAGNPSGDPSGDADGGKDGLADASESPTGADQGEGKGKGATDDDNAPDGPQTPDNPGNGRKPINGQPARPVEPNATCNKGSSNGGSYSVKGDIREAEYHLRKTGKYSAKHSVPGKLRYEIRRLFDNSSTTLFSPNRKTGSINVNSLHRYGQSDNLFQQRKDIDGVDSAVVLVLDISGSMFPRLIEAAIKTCAALIDALSSAEVATAVITFGDHSALIVPFGTRPQLAKKIIERVQADGSTNDYAAIKYAHDVLRTRRETRKVCMVLTDGQGWADAARDQCRAGDALGITTIGIGIGMDVSRVYQNHIRVDNIADLASVSFGKIKTAI